EARPAPPAPAGGPAGYRATAIRSAPAARSRVRPAQTRCPPRTASAHAAAAAATRLRRPPVPAATRPTARSSALQVGVRIGRAGRLRLEALVGPLVLGRIAPRDALDVGVERRGRNPGVVRIDPRRGRHDPERVSRPG